MAVDDCSLEDLLERQCGVITRVQALRYLTPSAVQHRLSSARWQVMHHGVYLAHSGPISRDGRRWVAVLGTVGGHAAWLGGLSALETMGFRGFPTDDIHVLLPSRLTPRRVPAGVVPHRTTLMPRSDLSPDAHPPRTTPARSLVDAAQWQPSPQRAAAIVMSGFQQRLACTDEVSLVLAALPRARHRTVLTEAVRDAAAGAESLPEAEFLHLCRSAGLPVPLLQHRRRNATGSLNYLDAYFPDERLHVEIDGGYHQHVEQWWADMQRQNALWIPGDRILRFPAWAIRHRAAEVTAQLRAALTTCPIRPAA
jgi:very-short-patch-repair endonuclease